MRSHKIQLTDMGCWWHLMVGGFGSSCFPWLLWGKVLGVGTFLILLQRKMMEVVESSHSPTNPSASNTNRVSPACSLKMLLTTELEHRYCHPYLSCSTLLQGSKIRALVNNGGRNGLKSVKQRCLNMSFWGFFVWFSLLLKNTFLLKIKF